LRLLQRFRRSLRVRFLTPISILNPQLSLVLRPSSEFYYAASVSVERRRCSKQFLEFIRGIATKLWLETEPDYSSRIDAHSPMNHLAAISSIVLHN
jgi:hypothetical protein